MCLDNALRMNYKRGTGIKCYKLLVSSLTTFNNDAPYDFRNYEIDFPLRKRALYFMSPYYQSTYVVGEKKEAFGFSPKDVYPDRLHLALPKGEKKVYSKIRKKYGLSPAKQYYCVNGGYFHTIVSMADAVDCMMEHHDAPYCDPNEFKWVIAECTIPDDTDAWFGYYTQYPSFASEELVVDRLLSAQEIKDKILSVEDEPEFRLPSEMELGIADFLKKFYDDEAVKLVEETKDVS